MSEKRAKAGLVLQGYFCIERFGGASNRGHAAQPKGSPRASPRPPRPELLPAKMRPAAAQPKPAREPDGAWSRAPRPELLPGMGPSQVSGARRVAQAQSSRGVSTTPIPAGQLRVIGEGRPLEPGILQTMERFFEADFSRVRVHEGPAASAMGALAFTLGEELHFAPGLYDPTTREGVELLGHELTHVVQQRDGRVANPYGQGIAIVQDPALEAEADRMGQKVAAELWASASVGQPSMERHPSFALLRRSRAAQPSYRLRSPTGGSSGGGGSGGGYRTIKTVKKAPPKRTIVITKAARKHYGDHRSRLPTDDGDLTAWVESSWNDFEAQDDGSYFLDLDEYDTRGTGGRWTPRPWSIVIRRGDAPNKWLVIHFGPASW
jgi:hypothetical protein